MSKATEVKAQLAPTADLEREEQFWDEVGTDWLVQKSDTELAVNNPRSFLSGSTVAFDYLLTQLGNLVGKEILDCGCGSGWFSTFLAQQGAMVQGFDISSKLVELGVKRARVNGVADRVHLKKMIAEEVDYDAGQFDAVVGISILHHVDLVKTGKEIYRVLKTAGKAHFIEPLGESLILNNIRNHVVRWHHGHMRAVDAEHPLTYDDIRKAGADFNSIAYREFQLTEMIARVTGDRITKAFGLRKLDEFLLKNFPSLRKYSRLVVITYSK